MRTCNAERLGSAAALVAASVLFIPTAALGQPYRVIDLGTFDTTPSSVAFGLNNLGRAVGASNNAASNLRGLLWAGVVTELAPLPGDELSQAFGINDAGQVAVMSFEMGELNVHGLLWEEGLVTDLGPLAPHDVNDTGTAAGYWSTSTASLGLVDHAARWQGGMLTDLGTLGGNFSYAASVSNWGQIVGWSSTTGDGGIRATLWQNGLAHDLGTLGGASSQAYGISRDSGHVVGVADTAAGEPHAFLFRVSAAGTVLSRADLGVLGGASSYAYDVNNLGTVVGTSHARAFRWEAGAMVDLNTLLPADTGWVLESARAINEGGQIAGTGLHNGQIRGFLFVRVGDLNADGDVEMADYTLFSACLGGPGEPAPPGTCDAYDFVMSDADGDGDADLADYAALQAAFGAP